MKQRLQNVTIILTLLLGALVLAIPLRPQSGVGGGAQSGVGGGIPTILGAITSYNGITTSGQGIPPIVAFQASTPTTPVGSTNILASAPAGVYRVSVYYVVTTAGTVGTSITVNLTYTDAQQAQTISTLNSSGLTLGQFVTGAFVIQQQATGNISYTITEGGAFTVHPVLALKIVLERLS
jgi:hypothetical protein